jgi:hypothetical protein
MTTRSLDHRVKKLEKKLKPEELNIVLVWFGEGDPPKPKLPNVRYKKLIVDRQQGRLAD